MSVSSQCSSDDSLFPYSIGCSGGTRSKGDESWAAGMSTVSVLMYLVTIPCVLRCIPKCLAEPSGVIDCGVRTCVCCSDGTCYRRQKSHVMSMLSW